jgi:peroxiredoxin
MKKVIFSIVLLICSSALVNAQPYPKGLVVGDKAPVFSGKDSQGETFDLDKKLKKGDVVIIFYRGQWCPYCNKQMSSLNDSLQMINAKGASLVAITPETVENVSKTIVKTKASFPIISDNNLAIMKSYQVDFAVDQTTQDRYKKFGIDFAVANGSNGANLPVPATYVIGKDGKIKYVFFNSDYRLRPSVKEILEHL